MIHEEYAYEDVENYLISSSYLLIAGFPTKEERSCFLSDKWEKNNLEVVYIKRCDNGIGNVCLRHYENGIINDFNNVDLRSELVGSLRLFNVEDKNVLLDLSSLDNVMIMFLTKLLICQIVPKSFFATYIHPNQYFRQTGTIGYALCDQVSDVKAIPGFAKRASNQQSLYAFLGFDGIRLKNILETEDNIEKFVPIIPFPTNNPQWFNVTMWNTMDVLQNYSDEVFIKKCFSDSVFEAIELLNREIQPNQQAILVPLGTRPHSLACAIFACKHKNTRIIYDYVIEHENRTIGIANITVYHLSRFLES